MSEFLKHFHISPNLRSFLRTFFMGALLSQMACQPQDKALRSPGSGNNGGNTPNGRPAVNSREDSNKQVLLMVDRISEAVLLLQAVLDPEFQKQAGTITAQGVSSDEFTIQNSQKIVDGDRLTQSEQMHTVQIKFDEQGQIQKVELVSSEEKPKFENFSDKKTKQSVALKNAQLKIVAVRNPDTKSLSVSIKTIDEINLKVGKSLSINEIKFVVDPVVISSNGVLNLFDVSQIYLKQNRVGASTDEFEMLSVDSKLSLMFAKSESVCAEVQGHVKLDSVAQKNGKPIYSRDLILEGLSGAISSGPNKTSVSIQPCSHRPLVDLSKLL